MAALAAGRSVDPSSYYFRGATFFETGAARYAWLRSTSSSAPANASRRV
jgi:hypothetical protein